VRQLLAAAALALALAAPALASESRPTLADLEDEIVCPVCTPATLDQSDAAIARQMKAFISRRIAAGDTKSEIKAALVAEFGERVLASPPRRGFNLLAWLLPIAGAALAAGVLAAAAWRWSRGRGPAEAPADPRANGRAPLDRELERRLDEELARFES
jgi:cytochrome c-type biogenesis protein CcmH/NrfF